MYNKKNLMQSRAESRINIIKNCETDLNKKIWKKENEKKQFCDDVAILNERIKRAGNEEEQVDFANKALGLNNRIKALDSLLWSYKMTLHKLTDLRLYAESFYDCGKYWFIVRKIPLKKLPKLVQDFDRVEEFCSVVYSLVITFKDKMKNLRDVYARYKIIAEPSRLDNEQNEDLYKRERDYISTITGVGVFPQKK